MENFEKTIIKLSRAFKIPQLEADDIAQELRIHLWENRRKYDKKRPFKNWAYILCRNKIKDLYRHYTAKKRDNSKDLSVEELREKGIEI